MNEDSSKNKINALQTILNSLESTGQFSAKFLLYTSVIGAIAIIGGANLPSEFSIFFSGIGVNILSSIIDRVSCGEKISNDELSQQINQTINIDKIERLLSKNDFFKAVAKLKRTQDVTLSTIHSTEYNIIAKLDELINYLRRDLNIIGTHTATCSSYIAHPYTLSEQYGFVGREKELGILTEWVDKTDNFPVFIITGFGGIGKSSLAWHWFNNLPNSKFDGVIWWSFYKTKSTLGNFISHGLAFLTGQSLDQIQRMPRISQEQLFIDQLNNKNILLVLDGLERLSGMYDNPNTSLKSVANWKRTIKLTNETDGRFLTYLTKCKLSRTLITSRVYPIEICDPITLKKPQGSYLHLNKMNSEDALQLWKSMSIGGDNKQLMKLFQAIHNNPLLLKVLGASILKYRKAPGDFDSWLLDNQQFSLFENINLKDAIVHVISNSLSGINSQKAKIIELISVLDTPIKYEVLLDTTVGKHFPPFLNTAIFTSEIELHNALVDLEERGLIAWDAINNVYEMHPIIHDFVWASLSISYQEKLISILAIEYSLLEMNESIKIESSSRDNTITIELFFLLLKLKENASAWTLLQNNFQILLLSDGIQNLHIMLQKLTNIAINRDEPFNDPYNFCIFLGMLSSIQLMKGNIITSKKIITCQLALYLHEEIYEGIITSLLSLSLMQALSGHLSQAKENARHALNESRRHFNFQLFGFGQIVIGFISLHEGNNNKSYQLISSGLNHIRKTKVNPVMLDMFTFTKELLFANEKNDKLAQFSNKYKLYNIIISIVDGENHIASSNILKASEIIDTTLLDATNSGYTFYEIYLMRLQAEVALSQKKYALAKKILSSILNFPEISEFSIIYIDVLNTLAEIHEYENDFSNSLHYSCQAYKLAYTQRETSYISNELNRSIDLIQKTNGSLPDMSNVVINSEKISTIVDVNSLLKIL